MGTSSVVHWSLVVVVVVNCVGGAFAAGGWQTGVKQQQQNNRDSNQNSNDFESAEAVTASEVEYLEGPLDALYEFLIQSRLQQFCKLLKDSDIEEIIVTIEGPWTLFAPTDSSFVFLPEGALEDLKRDRNLLRDFLLRHFVSGDVTSQQIQQDLVVDSLQSSPLRFNVYGPVVTVSGAQLLETDLIVGPGRVHIIDQPLFYTSQSDIVAYLQNNHNQMYELILATDLAGYISGGTFTFLAPDDKAFDYITSDLKTAIQSNVSLAERILLNHLLPGSLYLAGITDGLTWETVGGSVITFTTRRGLIFANDVPISQPEVSVTNGVVQTLNRVILPDGVEIDCQCKASVDDLQAPPAQTPGRFTNPPQRPITRGQATNRPIQRQPSTQRPPRPSSRPFNPQRVSQRPPTEPSRIGQPPRQQPNIPPRAATLSIWNATPATTRQPDDDSNALQPDDGPPAGQKRPERPRVTPPTRRPPVNQRVTPSSATEKDRVPEPSTESIYEGNVPGWHPNRDVWANRGTTIRQKQTTSWFNRQPTTTTRNIQAQGLPSRTTRRPLVTRNPVRSTSPTALETEEEINAVTSIPQRPTQRPQSWNQRNQVTHRQPVQQRSTVRPNVPQPPQRRPVYPPRTNQPPRTSTTVSPPSESGHQSCRQPGEPITPSNQNLPPCFADDIEPCQRFPYDVNDPRPFCPEDVPKQSDCVDPNEPYNPAELRPLCASPPPPPPPPTQGCRDANAPSYLGDRRPVCNVQPTTGCRDPSETKRPTDRRPVCSPAPKPSCRDPSEKWTQGDRRPLCRKPVLTGCRDASQQQVPSDNRPPCPTCREVGAPLDPTNPLPTCNTNAPSFGCRKSGEASYPQDTRPFCPEENLPEQDCRPFLERPKPGDRRPLCKVNTQPSSDNAQKKPVYVPPTQRVQQPNRRVTTRQPSFVGSTRQPVPQTTRSSWQPSAGPPQRPNGQPPRRPGKQPQQVGHISPPETILITNDFPPTEFYPTTTFVDFSSPFPDTNEYPTRSQSGLYPPPQQPGFQPGRNQVRPQARPTHSPPRSQPGFQPNVGVRQPQPPRTVSGGQPPQQPDFQPGRNQIIPQSRPTQPQRGGSQQPGIHQQQTPSPPRTVSQRPGFQQPQTGSFQPGQRPQPTTIPQRPGSHTGQQPPRTGSFQPGSQRPQSPGHQTDQICTRCPNQVNPQPGSADVPPPRFQDQQGPGTVAPRRPVNQPLRVTVPGGISSAPRVPTSVTRPNQVNFQPGSADVPPPRFQGQQGPGTVAPRRPVNQPSRITVPGRNPSSPRVPISVTGTSTTPGEDSRRSLYEIVEDPALLIRGHPVKLTKVFELFHKAGIEDVLTGRGPTTVFLPSDDAFATLPKGVIEQLEEYPELLRQVLLYHVTNEEVLPSAQGESYTVPSLQGMQLVITMLNGGRLILISGAKAIAVTRANNGIFYVINQLLYPLPYQDMVSAVRSRPDLSQLAALLELSGLSDSLQGVKPYTLFAPTDMAFAQLSPVVLQELTQNTTALQEILLNHLTEGAHYGREFIAGGTFPSARGGKLKFQVVSYGYKVNDVNIKTPEIVTGTGIIHLVDQVLLDPPDRQLLNRLENSATGEQVGSSAVSNAQAIDGQASDVADLARSMGLNRFASWITNTGLLEKIHDGGVYTVFAPTDDAVNALPQNVADSIENDPEQVKPLLKYHIVPQQLNLNSVSNEETASTLLEGKSIRFNVYQSEQADCKQLLTASGTPVGQTLGTMGSIQVVPVNQVLYQPSGNLQAIVDTSPILQNFSRAIRNARLSWVLSGAGPLTVFAPSDNAFQALTADEKKNLIDNRQGFTDLLKRHMTKGSLFSSGVQSDVEKKSERGEPLNISLRDGIMAVNSIPITFSDVTATNGVLHVIDQFL